MPKGSKTNLQKLILRLMHGKKAVEVENLVERIEGILEREEELTRKVKPKYVINRTVKHLEKTGMIESFDTEQSAFVRMTPEGRHKLRSMQLDADFPLPTSWDGKWRIVILDVPESKKEVRNALRYILKKANFTCLKNSVWISPYPFEHMLTNMKEDLDLTNEMIIIVSDQLDPMTEAYLRESF